MDIPQTTFNEGETLTIKCQFDSIPEETFIFLLNERPLVPNDRIKTTVKDNTYIIEVKNLIPEEDEGIYTLKSEHLILDTPLITVRRTDRKEKENVVEEIEEETITVESVKKPEITEIEIVEKQEEKVSRTSEICTYTNQSSSLIETFVQITISIRMSFYSYLKLP